MGVVEFGINIGGFCVARIGKLERNAMLVYEAVKAICQNRPVAPISNADLQATCGGSHATMDRWIAYLKAHQLIFTRTRAIEADGVKRRYVSTVSEEFLP